MQHPNHPNGYAPPTNGALSQARGMDDDQNWLRTPTVREALPFTPFSSIVPFNPELIPPPSATPYYNANHQLGDHQNSRRVLDRLSAGATSAENASRRCQQTIRDVQKLLDAESLTKYQFKKPQHIQQNGSSNNQQKQSRAPELSPFAKMVMESTNVPYRYLTPESPGTTAPSSVNVKKPSKSDAHKAVPTPQSMLKSPAEQRNGFHPSPIVRPSQETAPQSSQVLQAVVPRALSASELAGVPYVADSAVQQSGKQRNMAGGGSRTISIDQLQKGDAAVAELQTQLDNIFAAEDQFDPDSPDYTRLLTAADSDDGRVAILQTATQERLDSAVQGVAKYSRLDGISIEDLVRIQKLNERAVSATNSLHLQIGDDWSQDDIQFWLSKMEHATGGLLASRTLLRVMNAGRQEKELQSEDHVRAVLDLLKTVIDTSLVPTVEERSFVGEKVRGGDKPQHNPKFVLATNHRDSLRALLKAVTRIFRLLATLLSRVDVDESAISSIVYMCKSLIFAENAATDKDSVLGIQHFEETRKYAMDVLGRIFTRYNDQRLFVIDEVLHSLEKLPATKQSARQYRLPDCKPIQLVSALLIRLVQTSATRNSTAMHLRSKPEDDEDSEEDADGSDEDEDEDSDDEDYAADQTSNKKRGVPKDLASVARPLHDSASSMAAYIVRALVQRASTTAKNSDEPYRKLMDIFTEDFLNVLGSTDWPAAELLLRTMLSQFISLAENPKSPVPARNLGYELMGTMGAGILGLQMQTRSAARNVDTGESPFTKDLVAMFRNSEANNKDIDASDLLSFEGPYRFVLEYLKASKESDPQIQTAKGFILVQWATQIGNMRAGSVDSDGSDASDFIKDLSGKLRNMIVDPQWVAPQDKFDVRPSTGNARFASLLVTTNMTFCKAFQRLFGALLGALTDEHTLVKSRGIKSILTVVERDPSVLARNMNLFRRIIACMDDKSALVRENALNLIQTILALRADLTAIAQLAIERRASDPMPGVRKKAFKVLKDLYIANDGSENNNSDIETQLKVRTGVANTLIRGMADLDENVVDIVRSTLEELWFAPFHGLSVKGDHAIQVKLKYRSQAQILTRSIEHGRHVGDDTRKHMESLVRNVLTKSKTAPANERVCKTLIEVLFDGIIDPSDIPGSPSADLVLETLTIFSRACPSLMEAAQLERLEPYTNNLTQGDDLVVYKSVLTILRHAMPHVHNLSHDVLTKLQMSLMKSISRLPRTEIAEVAACLWTIDGELKNTERLVNLVASALNNIRSMGGTDLSQDPKVVNRITKLMNIVGQFGKACDFEAQLDTFKEKFKAPKTRSVADLAIEIVCPFTSPKQPLNIREAALDAVCAISQRWPKMFLRADVGSAFELTLKEKAQSLEEIFVSGLEGFFAQLATPGNSQEEGAAAQITGRERLARTYVASDQDGASSELAQRFLPDIIRLAESAPNPDSGDVLALTATKLIASILQQGLPHPKECGPTLVALETSPNDTIAQIAWKEHRVMHQKHETTIEKEYVRSVQRSLAYQQNVTGNLRGITASIPLPKSKLHYFWDVLKAGKLKVKHKFITNICQKLEFEPADLNIRERAPSQLLLARYVCENLAFFEYDRTDDLLKLLSALEKTFASVGTPVAQAIESDILKLNVAAMLAPDPMAIGTMTGETDTAINPARLKSLALASQILLIIWESRTFILHLWTLQKIPPHQQNRRQRKQQSPRARQQLRRSRGLHAVCERFVKVMAVDAEHKVPCEDEEDEAVVFGVGEGSASEGEGCYAAAGGGGEEEEVGG
ncbi:hypothetical protein Q7P37_008543 [Cladosporium fusiforme]